MVGLALMAMIIACLAQHLGLPQAIAMVMAKVAKCSKCLTFWITLIVLLIAGCNIIIAIMLAVVMAYASYYFGLVIILLQSMYEWLWEKVNKEK